MMKSLLLFGKIFALLALILFIFAIHWYLNKDVSYTNLSDKKILIVYYSHSNHTEEIAKMIKEHLNCNMKKIVSEEYDNKNKLELTNLVAEQIKGGYIPKINNIDISDYNVIFVGSPVWKGSISLPVKSFLVNNNFNSKTIIPFYTLGGFVNKSKLDNQIKEFSQANNVLPSFLTVYYKFTFINSRLTRWLNRISIQ